MHTSTTLATALAVMLPIAAQEPTPATPAAPAAAVLPAAGSPEATKLVDKGIEKMLAIGRGTFRTSEAQDSAMMRGVDMGGMGPGDIDIDGGWHQDLVWGGIDDDSYVRNGGRMVVKKGDAWYLRSSKLASGRPVPFTLDPTLLFTVLRELPAEARQVVQVASGEVKGKQVAVLSLTLDGEAASEFVASGAVPEVGGMGGMFHIGGLGGLMQLPQPEFTAHLAFFIDPENGDVLRLAARVFEKNEMFGNVQFAVAVGGNDGEQAEEMEEEEKEPEPKAGAPEWKHGLPVRKPAKAESVMTFRADFTKLGLASAPTLDDKTKALLRLR